MEEKKLPSIVEETNAQIANELLASGEFLQPRYSDKRDCYILIRRKHA